MTTTGLDTAVADIKDRIATAQRNRVRAEAERDAAAAVAATARRQLADEFGVDTIDQARDTLTRLEHDLAEQVRLMTTALDETGT